MEYVAEEQAAAHQHSGQLGGGLAVESLFGPVRYSVLATGESDDLHNGTQHPHNQNQSDVYLIGHHGKGVLHGIHNQIATHSCRVNQRTRQDAQNKGDNNFLRNQCEGNGENRGNNGQPANIYRFHFVLLSVLRFVWPTFLPYRDR